MTEWGDHGPYPDDWGPEERELWDSDPMTWRGLWDKEQWEELHEVYERAWFKDGDISPEEREQARDEYFAMTGLVPGSFDWESYREYLGYGTIGAAA